MLLFDGITSPLQQFLQCGLPNISNSPPRLTVVLRFSTSLQLNELALASEMGVGVIRASA